MKTRFLVFHLQSFDPFPVFPENKCFGFADPINLSLYPFLS